jgi:hypothetical protein
MTTRSKCHTLARKLGCELAYSRRRLKHVEIYLPAGMKMAGTIDVDALHDECELDEDIWPGVFADLETLDGGMEPFDDGRHGSLPLSNLIGLDTRRISQ